jgi:SAM-dependent methyltransferase
MGTMTDAVLDRELVIALEPERAYADRLRERYRDSPNVEVWESGATDPEVATRARKAGIDSAMSFNVFEHIEDDTAAFRVVHDSLGPGGKFACFVPAFPVLYGEMDRALGHFRRYRRTELRSKAEAAGFEVESIRHLNLPGFFAWFANGRILRSQGVAGGSPALGVYDATVVRLARMVERRWRPPFGQSLLLVARRPNRSSTE